MATLGAPNPPRTRGKEVGAAIYAFKCFWKTNEYNDFGLFLLILLENTGNSRRSSGTGFPSSGTG